MQLEKIIEGFISEYVFQPVLKSVAEKLIIKMSLGPQGFLASIVTKIVFYVGGLVLDELNLFIDLTAIILKNTYHRKLLAEATVSLKLLAAKVDINSEEFKNARKKLGSNFCNAIAINGVPDSSH